MTASPYLDEYVGQITMSGFRVASGLVTSTRGNSYIQRDLLERVFKYTLPDFISKSKFKLGDRLRIRKTPSRVNIRKGD